MNTTMKEIWTVAERKQTARKTIQKEIKMINNLLTNNFVFKDISKCAYCDVLFTPRGTSYNGGCASCINREGCQWYINNIMDSLEETSDSSKNRDKLICNIMARILWHWDVFNDKIDFDNYNLVEYDWVEAYE